MPECKIFLSILSPKMPVKQLLRTIADLHTVIAGVHFDVMDGKFVQNSTVDWQTPELLRKIKSQFPELQYSVHLMTKHPETYVRRYAAAGANEIMVHAEAVKFKQTAIISNKVRKRKVKIGIALNPETKIDNFQKIAPYFDSVLIMSVHPGKGGQKFIPSTASKIKKLADKFPQTEIAVDGGIDSKTVPLLKTLGAKKIVVGSAILKHKNPFEAAYKIKKALL